MTTFTPPVGEGDAWGDYQDPDPHERLFSFYGAKPQGETVWKDELGVWHQGQEQTWGNETSTDFDDGVAVAVSPPSSGLGTAQKLYQGGHTYDITQLEALDLIVAGYQSGINIAPVKATWKNEDLAKLTTKMRLTTDGTHATGNPTVTDNNKFTLRLSAGTAQGQSQLREFILHSDTVGWTNSHGIVEVDPPAYGTDLGGGQFIIPQMGVVLRAQLDTVNNKHTGITLNNGTIFALPVLNIGAWRSNPDGTGFQNRQFSWPLFENIPLPYGWEWELIGNIIRVRIFPAGESPDTTPWTHPTHARTLNLDTDCGSTVTVPTPMLPGTNGIISAHLGLDSRCATRIRRFEMERLS